MKIRKTVFLIATFLILFLTASVPVSYAQTDRFATCDACGFCPMVDISAGTCAPDTRPLTDGGNPVPGNWKACAKCLYPAIYPTGSTPDPGNCDSVRIIGNAPPTPYLGRQYTMLGCLTSSGGFENNTGSGASSFVQAIFDLLVFRITGGLALLSLMYGGFLVLTSQAEPERLNYGKRVVMGAIIGLIFALGSVFIVNIIGGGILRLPGFTGGATPTP